MRVQVLQHVPFEGPAGLAPLLEGMGAQVQVHPVYEGPTMPALHDFDALIVLGGPMSVNDEGDYAWLADEKALIRACIDVGKPVLGICLGAQLIASALAAKVYPAPGKEIGWFPLDVTEHGQRDWGLPASLNVLHWHGDTFDLPPGSVRLASTAACPNQAFAIGRQVLGLQFHLEMDAAAVTSISHHCAHELVDGPWIQSRAQLSDVQAQVFEKTQEVLQNLISRWLTARA